MLSALEYLKEKERMTNGCAELCHKCPLSSHNNEYDVPCVNLEKGHPEKAVEIVENWSKEHPVKTYLDDFLEKYPNSPMDSKGLPEVCPHNLYRRAIGLDCMGDECLKCWNQPLIED